MKTVAVGVMAKAPVAGRVKTRMAPALSAAESAELQAALVADVTSREHDADVRILFTDGDSPAWDAPTADGWTRVEQCGDGLGARLDHAARTLLATADFALIIGTDSPDLPSELLADARLLLETCDVVFTPAIDGGYCLVGVANLKALTVFEHIAWSTPAVLRESLARAAAAGLRVGLTGYWHDLDDSADARALLVRASLTRTLPPPYEPGQTIAFLSRVLPPPAGSKTSESG